ncbi:Zn-dependent hydrolase [Pelagibacterium flavum]|uniref:Zn-dependent hydrolase n=1 Tax=Pelagibacterium flavum TaxID=2984530 RepID=A0ABY6IK81_9HYPH|nr:Zn-dependent hydrolase [Pelagibacterium sp. YIM 151497]UYQ70901.1 Zn-dependent hydrolase [Pelagibacterium sp. YIM 151497]
MGSFAIDPDYVEKLILEMAQYGSDGGTGVSRTVYSPEWVGATRQYAKWCREAGLEAREDAVGNVWGRLPGSQGGKAIVTGSHIDTQTPGGRYDGTLGALAGIVALKVLRETYGQPRRTLECVALCEEENSRFPTAQWWGSRAVTGRTRPEDADTVQAFTGESIAEAMREVGLDPKRVEEAKRDDIEYFIELHIEQGPILEQAGLPVAVVTGVTGIRHYLVTLKGEQNHAGAFPMDLRRDPMAGFAEIASGVIDTAHRWGRPAVTTVGRVISDPNGIAVVPGSVEFSIDVRHPDPARVDALYASHERQMQEVAARRGLDLSWEILNDQPPCPSDPDILAQLKAAADTYGVPYMSMASGAGHDTQQMARIAKVAMIFVRSKDGRSHTPDEFSSIEDIVAGIKVLTETLYRLAY